MRVPSILLTLATLGACTAEPAVRVERSAPDLLLRVGEDRITGPDSIGEGWTRLRVEEDGGGHVVTVFRLAPAGDSTTLAAFIAALDTAANTPPPALAIGGPEVGDTAEVIVELTPGRYLVACLRRGREGHRHAATGEARLLVVRRTAAAPRAAPASVTDLTMGEFAFGGSERWPAGTQVIRVRNDGRQDHQVRVARLLEGITLRRWLDADEDARVDSTVAGIARMGPGVTAYLPVDLPPGRYVIYCLILDPVSGSQHLMLGMFREILVE